MARKNEKPAADGTTPAAGSPEESADAGTDSADSSSAEGEGTTPLDLPGALALLDSLRQENEELGAAVEALTRERDTALKASRINAEQYAKAKARRPEEKLLPLLSRLSREAQRSGDVATHAALERVVIAFGDLRHAVRESVKTAKGDAQEFLEDLEESL